MKKLNIKKPKLKKISKKMMKKILIAEAAVLLAGVGVFFAVGNKAAEEPVLEFDETQLSAETLALKAAMDDAKADEDAARAVLNEVDKELRTAERKMFFKGESVKNLRKQSNELAAFIATEEKSYNEQKAGLDGAVAQALERYNNCGWYFLNSKATTSIEYWAAKAKAYGGTSAAANTALFSSALSDAVKYDNLITASYQIEKSSSLGGINRQIDYNLMTAAAVSVAVYTANHSLTHTFAWKVIGANYGPWADENLAYGMSASRAWSVWYDAERANNGPHFRNINNKGRNTTGYGYTVKGSPAPSHAQEFGVNSSGAVLTTPAQFRADLTAFRDEAKKAYDEAYSKSIMLKTEPIPLIQARASFESINAKIKAAAKKAGIKYFKILEKYQAAEADYNDKHEAYLAAKAAYEEAAAKETGQEAPSEEGEKTE